MNPRRDVGVIGLGRMGSGIARRLDEAGRLGGAWDTSETARRTSGLSMSATLAPPQDLARTCEVILFVLPGSVEIEQCLSGPEGILSVDAPDQVLVDLTTSYPVKTKQLAELAAARGRAYLDAGMTGGAQAADLGRLTLMVGGPAAAIDRVRPVLDRIASRIFHLGESGAGHTMKLVHNMICHTVFLATSEGCRLAEKAGLDLSTVVAVLNAGNARSFISEARFPNHILSGTFDGRSPVSNLAKDLAMAADLERDIGLPGLYGPLTSRLLARAVRRGMAEQDFTRLYTAIEELMAEEASLPSPTAEREF
jgi:3-hydroxyisobutyrate dehydrogenase